MSGRRAFAQSLSAAEAGSFTLRRIREAIDERFNHLNRSVESHSVETSFSTSSNNIPILTASRPGAYDVHDRKAAAVQLLNNGAVNFHDPDRYDASRRTLRRPRFETCNREPDWTDACIAILRGQNKQLKVWTYDREFRTIWRKPDGTVIPLATRT